MWSHLLLFCLILSLASCGNMSNQATCVSPSQCSHPHADGTYVDQVVPLPYPMTALAPHLSEETLQYHYDKHHKGYALKLDELALKDVSLQDKTILDLIKSQTGKVYNLAAQISNHNFYWTSLSPDGGGLPPSGSKIDKAIVDSFGSFDHFKTDFNNLAVSHFGSGWVWLVRKKDSNQLKVVPTHDGASPLNQNYVPVLVIDVWEHAYYIDYRNNRVSYVEHFWNLVNWEFASSNLL